MMIFRQPFKMDWPITQNYGDTITSNFHTGIDYGCPLNTPILASADGTVVFAGWDKTGYGNTVIVLHSSDCATLYAHLSSIHVRVGEKVKKGELLGHSGTTGNSTGPHLHFEARKRWNDYKSHFDPMLLPMTSVDDTIGKTQHESGLIEPDKLKADVVVTAPSGAFAHMENFTKKIALPCGTVLKFEGEVIERDGLKFCKCELPVYIAVHNNDTQILSNI